MPRIARKDLNTSFLHVMVQGVNKEYIFNNTKYIEQYLRLIRENKANYELTIIAYCIMNNHAHFLVYTEDINSFGKFMQKINLLYAQMYNKREKRCGVLFRNRYQIEPIYDIKHLINCIKYIHLNPVKARIVSKCEDYVYSSYLDFIFNKGATQSDVMINIFGNKCDYLELFNQTYEREFMDIDNSTDKKYYIIEGIKEFTKENSIEIVEIMSDRERLKQLINFLKNEWEINYIDISKFFEMSRGIIDSLKTK
ncbi:MAG TPA: hypothetical protein DEP51_04240 [Clostridiales bacterium]|nr:hypothetical protein [Clostridiales bacterium]